MAPFLESIVTTGGGTVAKVEKMKVGDVPVTYLNIYGTYSFRFPPFDPNAKTTLRPNYRMIGVVLETKKGPYFIHGRAGGLGGPIQKGLR